MHMIVLGGSGRTGAHVIAEAQQRGDTVTALVRDASKFTSSSTITYVQGSPLSAEDVARAMDAPVPNSNKRAEPNDTAVLVALNNARASESPFAKPVSPPRLIADSCAAAAAAMAQRGVRKIVVMSAFGVADSQSSVNFLMTMVLRHTNIKVAYADHDAADAEMKARVGLDWVFVRPAVLGDGEAKPVREFGDDGKGVGMMMSVSRKSVAAFMLDAAHGDRWNHHTPVIVN